MTDRSEKAAGRPRVTFFVSAYNQEGIVHTAIEGAFAQTYQPLEIVLSDDCSSDGTFRVMQEMAAAYEGPHRIVLNRNPVNLGIPRHIDRIMEISSGRFVVQNSGDDVSLPERTATLVAAWLASGGEAKAIHSAKFRMDEDGRDRGLLHERAPLDRQSPLELLCGKPPDICGASMGWSREIFEVFGPLGATPAFDDYPICLRAATLGEVLYLDVPLVRYRVGGVSSSKAEPKGRALLYGHRLRALSRSVARSARHADWAPLRKNLKYALSPIYMSWHNIRGNAAMPRS